MDVNWTAVIVGAVLAYVAGWLWYSEKMFGTKWSAGVGLDISDDVSAPMGPAMVAQAFGTFLLAWTVGVIYATDNPALIILLACTYAVLVKAKGFFQMNTRYAIVVDATYVLVMVAIMFATQSIL